MSVIAQHHVGVTKITEKALLCDLWSVVAAYSYSVAHTKFATLPEICQRFANFFTVNCVVLQQQKIKIIQRDNIVVLLHLHKDLLLFDKRLF